MNGWAGYVTKVGQLNCPRYRSRLSAVPLSDRLSDGTLLEPTGGRAWCVPIRICLARNLQTRLPETSREIANVDLENLKDVIGRTVG